MYICLFLFIYWNHENVRIFHLTVLLSQAYVTAWQERKYVRYPWIPRSDWFAGNRGTLEFSLPLSPDLYCRPQRRNTTTWGGIGSGSQASLVQLWLKLLAPLYFFQKIHNFFQKLGKWKHILASTDVLVWFAEGHNKKLEKITHFSSFYTKM